MSKNINIIFFNCCGREEFQNQMENGMISGFDVNYSERIPHHDMATTISNIEDFLSNKEMGEIVSIHFVDEHYLINHYYTDEGKSNFNSIRENMIKYTQIISFHDCKPGKFLRSFVFNASEVYFIASYDNFHNEYHFFEFLDLSMENNYFVTWNITSFLDITKSKCYYDPFLAEKIDESFDVYGNPTFLDEDNFRGLLREGAIQASYLKEAGFFERERFIQKAIPAWCLNIQSAIFSSGIIRRYGLYPEIKYTEDRTISYVETVMEKFRESADYRCQILDIMCQVLVKHFIELKGKKIQNHQSFDIMKVCEI